MYIRKTKLLSLLLSFMIATMVCFTFFFDASSSIKKAKASQDNSVLVGIDVSYWQGNIDWEKVSKQVDFVMLRIGYSGKMDTKFKEYVKGASNYGIPMGVYYFSYADSIAEVYAEAEECIKWLSQYPATFSYPIVYDVEYSGMRAFAGQASKIFCDALRANGYYPMIYANTEWFKKVITPLSIVADIDFWQANYYTSYAGDSPSKLLTYSNNRPSIGAFNTNVKMWQCTDNGKVNGINGGVDTNICYVDYDNLIKSNGYNGFKGGENVDVPENLPEEMPKIEASKNIAGIIALVMIACGVVLLLVLNSKGKINVT